MIIQQVQMAALRGITRIGDVSTGHGCHVPTVAIQGSSNVLVNGIGAVRVGDKYLVHTCGNDTHVDSASVGSKTVKINGQFVMRVGDLLTPAGMVAEGSHSVFVGS